MARSTSAAATAPGSPAAEELLAGTLLRALTTHRDARGTITEFYRREWNTGPQPVQWTVTSSDSGVLRGVHVHLRHHDHLAVLHGHCTVGLRDLRAGSPSAERALRFELRDDQALLLTIPPGVAHGFYFHVPTLYVLGLTAYYDVDDELGCHWRDPALGIDWPVNEARLSDRDAAMPPLQALMARIPPWTPA
jgi:dTDP-4-dehydrorhamnose 3,5-epimerase